MGHIRIIIVKDDTDSHWIW